MHETAVSSTISNTITIIAIIVRGLEILITDADKVISKWPAIKFAVSRTLRVIGRISVLIVSIITIKGSNNRGVPMGTKWASLWLISLIMDLNMYPVHQVNPIAKENVRCLGEVNVYGVSPMTLLMRIKISKEMHQWVCPGVLEVEKFIPSSFLPKWAKVFKADILGEGMAQ